MARRHESAEGSLELLLDTITNTFGSVLFITMLVAVLLRSAGIPDEKLELPSKTDQARTEARISELNAEVERLRVKLDSLPSPNPAVTLAETEITLLLEETARVLAEDAAVAAETVADQERVAGLKQKMTELSEKLDRLKPLAEELAKRRKLAEDHAAELAKVAIELDKPVDPSRITQTPLLPELAPTKKEQVGIYIRYGRIYVMHEWGPSGERLGPNTQHFVITSRPDGRQSARARPDTGYIADGATVTQTMREILRRHPPDMWVVAVGVHEDSFSQFQTVKAALIALGYQYEPLIIRKDSGLWDSGGTGKRGQ